MATARAVIVCVSGDSLQLALSHAIIAEVTNLTQNCGKVGVCERGDFGYHEAGCRRGLLNWNQCKLSLEAIQVSAYARNPRH